MFPERRLRHVWRANLCAPVMLPRTLMKAPWSLIGNVLGAAGFLLALAATFARVAGQFHLAGFQTMTLFQGAVGIIVAACFFKLQALEQRR